MDGGSAMKGIFTALFGLFLATSLLFTDARSGVVTGTVHDNAQLDRVRNQWKLQMVSTKRDHDGRVIVTQGASHGSLSMSRTDVRTKRQKTYGCFIHCVLSAKPSDPVEIKYSYSYGEPDADTAAKKAAYAFDAKPGVCALPRPVVEYTQGDDL